MARGQSQAADTNLKTTNTIGAEQNERSKKLEDRLIPGYTSLMDTGYLSPEEANAAVTSEMGSAMQPFESAGFKASNTAAATRNDAALPAQMDALALEQGRTAGDAAAKLQEEKLRNEEAGMYGLGQLKSQDQQAMEHMYGLGPSTLSARAAGPGWSQGFKDVGSTISSFGRG